MSDSKSFIDSHKDAIEVLGFWAEEHKETVIKQIELGFTSEVIRENHIVDLMVGSNNTILVKWIKRHQPLTDDELKEIYGR